MSKVIEQLESKRTLKSTIVQANDGNFYYVDTNSVGYCLETMAFPWDPETRKVTSWGEVAVAQNDSFEEAYKAHDEMCENLESFWYFEEEDEEEKS